MVIKEFDKQNALKLDLSTSSELSQLAYKAGLAEFSHTLFDEVLKGRIGYGGYLEKRNFYEKSDLFYKSTAQNYRNIHLGIDVWSSAGTEIFAPIDCEIHSFKYNDKQLDYGNTIIVFGKWKGEDVYILFGHLSHKSLNHIKEKKSIKRGELIGWTGIESENGGWPPHLHLQMIKDMQGLKGDYPGLCAENEIDFYKQNCPDPTELLF